MKAVILVGGKATRLGPLTRNIPKAMVPVLNIPFLEHVIRHLHRHQIKEIILAQGHLAQPIESYLGDGHQWGVRLYYSTEDSPRGTAGAVKSAERYLDETFLMLSGDIFTELDITAMVHFHRERKAKATIALSRVADPTSYGLVETDVESRVTRFLEKPRPEQVTTNMINASIYVLEPEVLAQIPPQREASIERETFPKLLSQQETVVCAYPFDAYWIDIGTPEKYFQLHWDLLSGQCREQALIRGKEVLIDEPSHIHPTARITGPAIIGANCSIGRGVILTGPIVIGSGSSIGEDSVIKRSIIWNGVRIERRTKMSNSIVANNCCLTVAAQPKNPSLS